MKILVTGATGKVGQTFMQVFLADERFTEGTIRALCHNRSVETSSRVEMVRGSISDRDTVQRAIDGVTHVVHLATCKETPDNVMDVTVKGLFWLLEECRDSEAFKQFIMIGGDAGMGHFFYPHPIPVTETQKHTAYPGCYALSKVLEEVMLEQYYVQYDFNGCCLRAPWIMEKDDFKYTLSFGNDVFGGPRWNELVDPADAKSYAERNVIPVMMGKDGKPVRRNFVHVDDLISAILQSIDHPKARQETFNVSMDEPVHYGKVADYLKGSRNLDSVEVQTEYSSTWLDNSKAKFLLDWKPQYDLARLIDSSWDYERGEDDPRKVWYPG